mmetsp:Transcript_5052/g.14906  ORF Transcript_5052/g.14906 Transcript_5052/m.14906 type:complete len:360 (+) Transcript_5052:123-1202(+)
MSCGSASGCGAIAGCWRFVSQRRRRSRVSTSTADARAGESVDCGGVGVGGVASAVGQVAEHRSEEELLAEVAKRSKAVLYVVSNKGNDRFSMPNLSKYLRMKGVVMRQGRTPEETLLLNASLLLEVLDKSCASGIPRAAPGAPLRHEMEEQVIPAQELQVLFPEMRDAYVQQPLDYGRNSRYGDRWRISCYLVVMENWKPKIMPHEPMVRCMTPTMNRCTQAFARWYCRIYSLASVEVDVMNAFVTRYRALQEEDQLKRHIDGSNVDGSVILALPTDDPFEGGALHVWDGKPQKQHVYQMRPGDCIFMDNAVWHQAMPISKGTRWALVLFLRLRNKLAHGGARDSEAVGPPSDAHAASC